MTKDERDELLKNTCDCPLCSLTNQVILFTESLIGPRELESIKEQIENRLDSAHKAEEVPRDPAVGLVLTSALAETAFRQMISPPMLHDCVSAAYDLRVQKLMKRIKDKPELSDKVAELIRDLLDD